jgi:hypoxanthine-DNA glycosylase
MEKEYLHLTHPIEPVCDKNCKILILGSFPSVKSREANFFYGHPQNRFWKILSHLSGEPLPQSIKEKKSLLLSYHIAVWDVIASCDIVGSSDSSIKNVVANDIGALIKSTKIEKIFANGKTAERLYLKYVFPKTQIQPILLPSSSPANAAKSFSALCEEWKQILL